MSLYLSQCCPCGPTQLCLDAAEAVYLLYAWTSVPSLSSHHPAVGILAPLDIRHWPSGIQRPVPSSLLGTLASLLQMQQSLSLTGWSRDSG